MLEVITLSSKGQLVVPRSIRKEMGLEKEDKFVIVHDKNSILLKRIKKEEAKKAMLKLLDKFSEQFKKNKITKKDVEEAIKEARAKK